MVIRLLLGEKLGAIDIVGLGIPLLAIVFAEPLKAMIDKKQGRAPEQGSGGLIGGLVELLDRCELFCIEYV